MKFGIRFAASECKMLLQEGFGSKRSPVLAEKQVSEVGNCKHLGSCVMWWSYIERSFFTHT